MSSSPDAHRGATDADSSYDRWSPVTTSRDRRSTSRTPSPARTRSPRRPRGRAQRRQHARSNSSSPSRQRGGNRRRRDTRGSPTSPRRSRKENQRLEQKRRSPTTSSSPSSRSGTERGRSRQRDTRTRDSSRNTRRSRSRSRGRGETARGRARSQRSTSRNYHGGDRRAGTTPRSTQGDRRGRLRNRPRDRRSSSRGKRSRGHSPQRERDAPRTHKRNRRVYTTEGLREEREHTGGLRGPIHTLRGANQYFSRAAGAPRGDVGRPGAHQGQHTPADLWGGPRAETAPFMSAHEAGRFGRLHVEAPKTIEQLRQLITGGIRCPVFTGSKAGELSICNSAVMLQDKIVRTLNTHELGELRLPRDEQDERGFHIRPDASTFRRRELLAGLIGDNLLTHYQLTAMEPVKVITIFGATEVLNHDHVTLTDWLRILVREQALVIDSTDMAREAFHAVQVRPEEDWRNVASRLVRNYRAVVADPDRPHASEAIYVWRYVTERQLYELFERVINAVLTNPLDRLSLNPLLHDAVARVKHEVRTLPIAFHDPLGRNMQRRGRVTENVFSDFVDRLALRSSAYRAVTVLPRNAQPTPSKGVTQLFSLDEVRQLFSSRGHLTALEPAFEHANNRSRPVPQQHPANSMAVLAPATPPAGSTPSGTWSECPAPEAAAFTNQVTAPGQHGVPFQQAPPRAPAIRTTLPRATQGPVRLALTTGPHSQQAGPHSKPAEPGSSGPIRPPGMSAPRTDIVDYLRKTSICFRYAFGSPCSRHLAGNCPFVHDIIPEGAFAGTSSARTNYGTPNVRPPRRLVAMTDEARELLAACGIDTQDSDDQAGQQQCVGGGMTHDDDDERPSEQGN